MVRELNKTRILYSHMKGVTSGGSDTCLYLLLKELDLSKYEPYLLYRKRSIFIDQLEERGIKLIHFPEKVKKASKLDTGHIKKNTGSPVRETSNARESLHVIKRMIKKFPETLKVISIIINHKIQIIHANHSINSDRSVILAAILLRKKIISHNRGLYNPSYLDKFFAKKINKIVNMSDFSKNVYINHGIPADKCITRYDGVDVEKFKSSYPTNEKIVIGCIGRLEKWKGQQVLIDAAEIIVKETTEVQFLLIGDGNNEHNLRNQVREKSLDKFVEFTGGVTNVQDYIDKCTIIAHTSIEPEPFGMVIIEAMAFEKPVIATNFGGPLEIITDQKDGFLIPPNDPKILAEVLFRLIKDDSLRAQVSKSAREKVLLKFEVGKYTRQIEQVYQENYG